VDHFKQIYTNQAAAYHQLIAAEDADGNLPKALKKIAPLVGKRILDVGSGSGRIPLMLKDFRAEIVAADLHRGMLIEQQAQRELAGGDWALLQADGQNLPVRGGWADVVTAGWAFGHFTGWYPDSWKQHAAAAIAEMARTAAPGGVLIIMETMGTGSEAAGPPNAALAEYYAWLESEHGFARQVIATDYDFGSVERAAELCSFFFGAEMAEKVRARGWQRVPEWTGIWSKRA
jgi:ubiquinone/menaquinone biosynthesis C-methylase UbiE